MGRHLIVGTSGHIDHGKTALVRALTDFDCDTHPEEKKRGITMNLGFTHLDLDEDHSVGIVDVPGHKDFVHTMVAGAAGIDFVLFVIAADSGVMPQTKEHLQILEVLGVSKGIVVITKTDLVEPDLLEITMEEVKDFIQNTFLEHSPIIGVSSKTGDGLADLKKAVLGFVLNYEDADIGNLFRMYIDRIFSIKGFGTVVTGSVISGILRKDDKVYLLPSDKKELRVRRIERHGKDAEIIYAGDRAAINLVGLERNDFERGMIISDRKLRSSFMIDASLKLFEDSPKLGLWTQVIFHTGSYEGQAKIHLIDKDVLKGAETGVVQIHLEKPGVMRQGDKFVIRKTSSDMTLGGGEVLDAAPLHHRRRPPALLETVKILAKGDLKELIALEVRKKYEAINVLDIANNLNVAVEEVEKIAEAGLEGISVFYSEKGIVLIVSKKTELLSKRIIKSLEAYHRRNEIDPKGLILEELMGNFGIKKSTAGENLLLLILQELVALGTLKKVGATWALASHNVEIDPKTERQIDWIATYLKACGMNTPLMSELIPKSKQAGISEADLKRFLHYLVREKKVYVLDGNYVDATVVDKSREKLLRELMKKQDGITVAQFRDLVDGNRKICLLLIAQYDGEGVTMRVDNVRKITEKGKALLA
jgi:selenocysteine-specific elongation factor